MFEHKSRINTTYKPVLTCQINWTWRGRTHYLSVGNRGKKPFYPGRKV